MLSDRFAIELDRLGCYRIVARSKMKEILEEQKFQANERCSAAECAVEAGQLLGAQYMVYGSIGKIGELFSVNTFLVDVESGVTMRSATTDLRGGKEEALTILMARNAYELLSLEPPANLMASMTNAFFNITVVPNHARLTLDEKVIRPGVVQVAPNQDYAIEASLPGYHSYSIRRRTSLGKTTDIEISLQPVDATPMAVAARRTVSRRSPWEKDVIFGLRAGVSLMSGLIGVELQMKHVAVVMGGVGSSGWIDIYGGLKYYFRRATSSWYVGVGGLYMTGDEEEGYGDDIGLSGVVGYRWVWKSGWSLTLGMGAAAIKYEEEDDIEYFPAPDWSIGYSF